MDFHSRSPGDKNPGAYAARLASAVFFRGFRGSNSYPDWVASDSPRQLNLWPILFFNWLKAFVCQARRPQPPCRIVGEDV